MLVALWLMVVCSSVGALNIDEIKEVFDEMYTFKPDETIYTRRPYVRSTTARHPEASTPSSRSYPVDSSTSDGYPRVSSTTEYVSVGHPGNKPDESYEGLKPEQDPDEGFGRKYSIQVGSSSGIPGINFPDYTHIPLTSFSCSDKLYFPGFYADTETGCQVFHVCYLHRRESFLCPLGATFNQALLACDYWYNSNCSLSQHYYDVNAATPHTDTEYKKEAHLGSMIDTLLAKGHIEPTIMPLEDVTESVLKKMHNVDLSNILKLLPVKAKVVVYPESTNSRGKIIAEASVGKVKAKKQVYRGHKFRDAPKPYVKVPQRQTVPLPQQKETTIPEVTLMPISVTVPQRSTTIPPRRQHKATSIPEVAPRPIYVTVPQRQTTIPPRPQLKETTIPEVAPRPIYVTVPQRQATIPPRPQLKATTIPEVAPRTIYVTVPQRQTTIPPRPQFKATTIPKVNPKIETKYSNVIHSVDNIVNLVFDKVKNIVQESAVLAKEPKVHARLFVVKDVQQVKAGSNDGIDSRDKVIEKVNDLVNRIKEFKNLEEVALGDQAVEDGEVSLGDQAVEDREVAVEDQEVTVEDQDVTKPVPVRKLPLKKLNSRLITKPVPARKLLPLNKLKFKAHYKTSAAD